MVPDGEPEAEIMTSSSSGRHLSWFHLCVIYSLLGIYGVWAATSYQLMRCSLLEELEAAQQNSPNAGGELASLRNPPVGFTAQTEDLATIRHRRSVDNPAAQGDDVVKNVEEMSTLSRRTRDTTAGKRRRRRRKNRNGRRQSNIDGTSRRVPAGGAVRYQREFIIIIRRQIYIIIIIRTNYSYLTGKLYLRPLIWFHF